MKHENYDVDDHSLADVFDLMERYQIADQIDPPVKQNQSSQMGYSITAILNSQSIMHYFEFTLLSIILYGRICLPRLSAFFLKTNKLPRTLPLFPKQSQSHAVNNNQQS